ncbi:hypothetical protein GCM10028820_28400 [Tessaracoccus terricola]
MKIRLGTKDSTLAMLRAEGLIEQLEERGHEVEIFKLPNVGDFESIGQLRLGLLRDDFDVVVHRINRLPDGKVPGTELAAVPERGDRRDVFIGRDGMTISALPDGARIGVATSLRRAKLTLLRPGLEYEDIKPNLSECLDRIAKGELDGVLCGAADVDYLERTEEVTERLETPPAAGQGALGYECREDDKDVIEVLAEFDHPDTRICVAAEQAVKESLDLSEKAEVGVRAHRHGVLSLRADVFPLDGSPVISLTLGMPTSEFHAVRTGHRMADLLRDRGAEEIGRDPKPPPLPPEKRHVSDVTEMRVLVAREEGRMSVGLRSAGLAVDAVALQTRELLNVSSTLDGADWIVFTSTRAVASIRELGWTLPRAAKIAAVGPGTADALESMGYDVELVPDKAAGVNALLEVWPEGTGTVYVPGSALLAPSFLAKLQQKGYTTHLVPVYTMETLPVAPPEVAQAWREGLYDAVIIASGSNALAVGELLGWNADIPVIAVGESAQAVLRRAHVPVAKFSDSYRPQDVVGLLRELVAEQER